jgi:ABC-type sugar transport system substrate-binding protein
MTAPAGRLAVVASLLAVFGLGCGDQGGGSATDPRGASLAAAIKALDNPFFVTMRNGLVATARREDARLRVAAAASGLHDTAGQAAELEALASAHPDCYVVNPINETNLVGTLARVAEDVPVIDVDSVVSRGAAKAVGVEVTGYIGTNNRAGGRLGADAMASAVDHGAKVAVITGIPGDIGSGLRAGGFKRGARGRFEVVPGAAADFERTKARLAATELMRRDAGIAGFFAVNDVMALGVADAVRSAGKQGEVAVIGFDGIREALSAVRRGELSATVAQYPYTMGQLAIEACLAALRGEDVPPNVDAPVQVVTRANVARAQAKYPEPVEQFDDPFAR